VSNTELERRLNVLESVVGIDPEVKCHGAGDPCPDGCEPQKCPLRHNNIQGIARMLTDVLDESALIRCWAEELEDARAVPKGSWDRAVLRVRLIQVTKRLDRATELQGQLGTVEASSYTQGLQRQIHKLREEQASLRASIADRGSHETTRDQD